jgi:hypothetical protein
MNKSLSTITITALLLLSNTKSFGMEEKKQQDALRLMDAPTSINIQQKVLRFVDVPTFYAISQTSWTMHRAVSNYELLYSALLLKKKTMDLNCMHTDWEQFRMHKKHGGVSKELYAAFDDKYWMSKANLTLALCCKYPKDRISFARKVAAPYTLPWQSLDKSN